MDQSSQRTRDRLTTHTLNGLIRELPRLPIALIQGIAVRLTTERLPEPEGNRSGRCGLAGPLKKLLVIGDSAAAGVGVSDQSDALAAQLAHTIAQQNTQVEWYLAAQTGDRVRDGLQRIQAIQQTFTHVVCVYGVNDVTHLTPIERFKRDKLALITQIKQRFRPQKIFIVGIPDFRMFPKLPNTLGNLLYRRGTSINQAIADVAAQTGSTHVPFSPGVLDPSQGFATDGFHPSGQTYAQLARHIAQKVTI